MPRLQPTDTEAREARAEALSKGFTPGSPINDSALFAGRKEERRDIMQAIRQTGQHVILFGERGVGKTSLANILGRELGQLPGVIALRVNCDRDDDFSKIWHKVFGEIKLIEEK